ncbi:MAG: hypothetical protein LBU66_04500 [Treponema sp.]|jgi:hypothetical protein|nr:hypothetical protein [Treponema sp.]
MRRLIILPLLLLLSLSVWAQEEALSFVGMTVAQLIERFGAPVTVAAARGNELWQDDVVFQYAGGDFYVFRDRVWQVRLDSAFGISNGDPKAAVLLIFGDTAKDMGDHVQMPVSGRNWALELRVNFNNTGNVSAIFLYRPDF